MGNKLLLFLFFLFVCQESVIAAVSRFKEGSVLVPIVIVLGLVSRIFEILGKHAKMECE